jgi:small basic protein
MTRRRKPASQPMIVQAIWGVMALSIVAAIFQGRWSLAFVALSTIVLSALPILFERRFDIRLPVNFFVAIVLFVVATIFLGEAFDFYERYWWWDVVLHGGSAVGFGLIGFVFVFMLFEGDRYNAPAWAVSFLAFCFSLSVGALWEIFEFAMDQSFGLNMQKSGLLDTMWDLIVDTIGATIGALAGFFFLKRREFGGLSGVIAEFVSLNRRYFRRMRR